MVKLQNDFDMSGSMKSPGAVLNKCTVLNRNASVKVVRNKNGPAKIYNKTFYYIFLLARSYYGQLLR